MGRRAGDRGLEENGRVVHIFIRKYISPITQQSNARINLQRILTTHSHGVALARRVLGTGLFDPTCCFHQNQDSYMETRHVPFGSFTFVLQIKRSFLEIRMYPKLPMDILLNLNKSKKL